LRERKKGQDIKGVVWFFFSHFSFLFLSLLIFFTELSLFSLPTGQFSGAAAARPDGGATVPE
jgi:hypothetical protein